MRDFIAAGAWTADVACVVLGPTLESPATHKNIAYMETIKKSELLGFDFFVFDDEYVDISIVEYMHAGIVPIVPKKHTFPDIITPFDPMHFAGNSFHYEHTNAYSIFGQMVRFTENMKFPADRRTLVKNVLEAF